MLLVNFTYIFDSNKYCLNQPGYSPMTFEQRQFGKSHFLIRAYMHVSSPLSGSQQKSSNNGMKQTQSTGKINVFVIEQGIIPYCLCPV